MSSRTRARVRKRFAIDGAVYDSTRIGRFGPQRLYSAPQSLKTIVALVGLLSVVSPTNASDWPRWRGAASNQTAQDDSFSTIEQRGLTVVWSKALGGGYSAVSVVKRRAVTMFSDGESDSLVALDPITGDEIWKHHIDRAYPAHDGSFAGPISTPAIADGRVFALGPRGVLIAVDLESGAELWRVDLVERHGARAPFYGFSSSPLPVGEIVAVQFSTPEGTFIHGFDVTDGALVWSAGADRVHYQSPMTITIDGREQILAVGGRFLYGIDPSSGQVLWEHKHDGDISPFGKALNPVAVGDNRIFLANRRDESVLLEARRTDGGIVFEEVWTSPSIHGTFDTPVYHDGYLYGFSSRFLTCVDAATGEAVWKSRQPGDGFVILVGDHLVIVTKTGSLHVAEATPTGYREVARLAAFTERAWAPASFAQGRLFARSHAEIVAIELSKSPGETATASAVAASRAVPAEGERLSSFLREVDRARDKSAVVGRFLESIKSFPLIEGTDTAHFLYLGDAVDVSIVGDLIGDRLEEPFTRITGTDLFYYTARLEPDARINYRIVKDFEEPVLDPLNARRAPALRIFRGGTDEYETSWLAMPGWVEPDHLREPEGELRGRIETLELASERQIDIYLPAGYDAGQDRYPVAYIHWGGPAQRLGLIPNTLDNLTGEAFAPLIAVFIHEQPAGQLDEFTDAHDRERYLEMLRIELVPLVDARFRTIPERQARASIGMGHAGQLAFLVAFQLSDLFGKVGGQSLYMLTSQEKLLREVVTSSPKIPLDIYLDWGKYDSRSPLENWDMVVTNRSFAAFLRTCGYQPVAREANEGFGWASWRNRTDRLLATLFPVD